MKKISFFTLGCRLNQAEEELLRRQFLEAGFFVSNAANSDILIVNTCSVTALADKKSRQAIRRIKKQNPHIAIIVIGCGALLAKDLSEVSMIIPNGKKDKVFDILIREFELKSDFSKKTKNIPPYSYETSPNQENFKDRTRALLKVQDGCNNFCAFCIVPSLRGRERSFSLEEVIKEAKKLERLGYKELVITGVNVGKYRYSIGSKKNQKMALLEIREQDCSDNFLLEVDLYLLIKALLKNTNFPRIRLSSINPQDINDKIISLWANEPRLSSYFHISLQSGSENILKRMKRPYTAQNYYSIVRKIIKKIPGIAITTDIIVGFPGESDQDFRETINFVKKVKFAKIHVFPFSSRAGTKAFYMKNHVAPSVIKERAKTLRLLGAGMREAFCLRFVNTDQEVLFEKKRGDYWYGLTSNYIKIRYKSEKDLRNKFTKIRIKKSQIAY